MIMKDYKADEGLQGNDKIEKAIAGLQKETTQEMQWELFLFHSLKNIIQRADLFNIHTQKETVTHCFEP